MCVASAQMRLPLLPILACPAAPAEKQRHGATGYEWLARIVAAIITGHTSNHSHLPPTSGGCNACCAMAQARSHHLFTAPVGEFGSLQTCATIRALPVGHRPGTWSYTSCSLLSDLETYLTEHFRSELAIRLVRWRPPCPPSPQT